ncbi:transmembrane protein 237B isoform X1 [Astyanax mexicanus]|uniref:Transmembrane protein 237B n=2 Tax=Astyanax mexicanus TaxID=7994 RepID=A0A8B9LUI7_ASTMX|nr:transmembrane protein 237B isoform X1 [Astyanax mexicanus]KAG9277569.1 transmembrane protein 237B [Astyanax mexicanus]
MDTDILKAQSTRRRDLPPLSHRGPRALPSLPSQDTADEMPIPRAKKKKPKREVDTEGVEGPEGDAGMEMGDLDSHRQSESQERLSPEPQENPPQRKKKKKKAQIIDPEGDQTDLVQNGDMPDQNTDEEPTRKPKKRKVKPKVADMQLNNELAVEDDDIITDAQPPIPQHALFSAPHGQSQPVAKVFIERGRRFQPAERIDMRKTSDQPEQNFMDLHSMWTTRDVSMRVHRGFRVIGLFSHGFLAGYAVWNIIVMYILAGEQMSTLPNLLQQYHTLAYPAQSLFYFLLALSTVSAFDRVNLAKASVALRSFLTLDPVALASFLYFSALVLSLSQQMTSDRINLYSNINASLWLPESEHSSLYPWIIVNLVVTLLVGLAWVLVSTSPDVDYTEEFLMAMEIEYPRAEEKDITA